MNDPNGLIFAGGRYHLFYQYNPHSNVWDTIHWGHASSADLLHWQHHPIALAPEPGSIDGDGVFSGCATLNGETPTLMYTAHRFLENGGEHQVLALATSDALMLEWVKHPRNPVLEAASVPLALTGFRDPFLWREADGWHLAVGAGLERGPGLILHYTSPNLLEWDYQCELLRGILEPHHRANPADPLGLQTRYGFWECPNFFAPPDNTRAGEPAGEHVLLVSRIPERDVWAFIGDYDGRRFHPRAQGAFGAGLFYAPQTFRDGGGRTLCFGWIPERGPEGAGSPRLESEWNGVMSLPRVLTLEAGRLMQRPAPELEALRSRPVYDGELTLESDVLEPLPFSGDALELKFEVELDGLEFWRMALRGSSEGAQDYWLVYDALKHTLSVDLERSSFWESGADDPNAAWVTLKLEPQHTLRLHVFLDASVLEVFVDGQALTSRLYSSGGQGWSLALFARGPSPRTRMQVWALEDVWEQD